MSKNLSTVSDAAVDLEKGTAALKDVEKEEVVAIVDPQKAKLVNRFMDAVVVLYALFFIGFLAYLTKIAVSWMILLLTVLALIPIMWICFWLISKLREAAIVALATKRSVGSGSNLSTKLLS